MREAQVRRPIDARTPRDGLRPNAIMAALAVGPGREQQLGCAAHDPRMTSLANRKDGGVPFMRKDRITSLVGWCALQAVH
jgi:hypothetical protein